MTLYVLSFAFISAGLVFLAARRHVSGLSKYLVPTLWKLSAIASAVLFIAGFLWDFKLGDRDGSAIAHPAVEVTSDKAVETGRLEGDSTGEGDNERVIQELDSTGEGDNERVIQEYIDSLDKKIECFPNNSEAYKERGWAYSELSRCNEALADLTKSIKLKPTSDAYCKRAWVYITLAEEKKAASDARRALRLDPKNTDAQDALDTATYR